MSKWSYIVGAVAVGGAAYYYRGRLRALFGANPNTQFVVGDGERLTQEQYTAAVDRANGQGVPLTIEIAPGGATLDGQVLPAGGIIQGPNPGATPGAGAPPIPNAPPMVTDNGAGVPIVVTPTQPFVSPALAAGADPPPPVIPTGATGAPIYTGNEAAGLFIWHWRELGLATTKRHFGQVPGWRIETHSGPKNDAYFGNSSGWKVLTSIQDSSTDVPVAAPVIPRPAVVIPVPAPMPPSTDPPMPTFDPPPRSEGHTVRGRRGAGIGL